MFWVRTEGAPTRWTYFDVLGRAVLEVTQAFQSSADASFSAVCSYFDAAGRSERTSEPFFLRSPEGAGAPEFAEQPSPCSQGRLWTRLGYDAVGRPVKTTYPDDSLSEIGYAGLATTIIDQNGHARSERRNALGELVQATDAAGLRVSYAYAADGGLESVSRDGGRGALVTRFVYDALGRKIGQSDPDAGVWVYAYNAAGELIEQVDAKGNPIVQSPWEGQNWNPYAYVLNNPLSFTDPSGYSFFRKYWRQIVAVVVSYVSYGAASSWASGWAASATVQGAVSGAVSGLVGGAVASGSVKGGVQGAFSGAVLGGIGGHYGGRVTVGRVAASGLAGGVLADLQGGKFGHGFLSAGVAAASGPYVPQDDVVAGATVSAILGGSVSALTGGKFANGAVTGAMSYAFSSAAREAAEAQRREQWMAEQTAYNRDTALAFEPPPLPQWFVDGAAGFGDALLLGAGGYLRDWAGVDGGIDTGSTAYTVGSWSTAALGGGRLAYAGLAKGYSMMAPSGAAASAFRETLKHRFRLGMGSGWRRVNTSRYANDAALRAAAGRTNIYMNAYGAGTFGTGLYGPDY
ncbi:MAG: hypothetical protein KatS3mg126_0009 [Lysobacteraceae bacterium]|nr:MAG: hypothetical protein KatS3mg126_0009 [Xanthomonadaceae bacterium]